MDRHFLEFWGNFLLDAAKNQKRMEDLVKWINQGSKGFEDLTALFRTAYGLNGMREGSPDYLTAWKESSEAFRKSLEDYIGLLGAVPRSEHLTLIQKYEELKQKSSEQEETIKHLRTLLAQKELDQGDMARGLQDLIHNQTDQFQELMKGFFNYPKDTDSSKG
jgi:hypothetical protein